MSILGLFPVPVGRYSMDKKLTKKQIDFISKCEKKNNDRNRSSVDVDVLRAKEMESVKTFCEDSLNNYFKEAFAPVDKYSLTITQSWFNYSTFGEEHHQHHHPNSLISAVLFIDGDEEQDKIYFSTQDKNIFQLEQKEFNLWNSTFWWLPLEKNTMLLFPSYLQHWVDVVQHDKERVTMSFNTFPVGELGMKETLTYVNIKEVGL